METAIGAVFTPIMPHIIPMRGIIGALSDIIPLSNIIKNGKTRWLVIPFFWLFNIIPHTVGAFVFFFVEVIHNDQAFSGGVVGVLRE